MADKQALTVTLPENILWILNKVPLKDRPWGEEETKFWRTVASEMAELIKHAGRANNPEIVFNHFRQAGTQYTWEFYVNDRSLPDTREMNYHLQNTSQWLYAGAIVLNCGHVSAHH